VIGVAVAQVVLAGAEVAGFQVGGCVGIVVEVLVAGGQQYGAGSLALPVGLHREDGWVVRDGGVAGIQRDVEGREPFRPAAGHRD
jgi:hypothetical protein